MADGLVVTGLSELQQALKALGLNMLVEAGNALRAEGELIVTEAKRRTPVLTGVLRDSGHPIGPEIDGRSVSVKLTFGGAASGYAIFVHENVAAHHHVGQSKFLESAVLEAAPYLAGRVARRIDITRAAKG